MNSVIIVTHRDFDFGALRRAIPDNYEVDDAANGCIVIEREGQRLYLGPDPHIPDELEPEEALRIFSMIPDAKFYTLDYSDISLCKDLLNAMVDRPDVLVDNNHGVLLPGPEFLQLLRSRPDWDWRLDPVQ
jgi:hypothetical protein